MDCQWKLWATDLVSVVVVSVQDFYIEKKFDFVYMDGTLLDGHTSSFQLSGTTQLKSISFTSSKTIYVRFTVDSFWGYRRGFHLLLEGSNGNTTGCNKHIKVQL